MFDLFTFIENKVTEWIRVHPVHCQSIEISWPWLNGDVHPDWNNVPGVRGGFTRWSLPADEILQHWWLSGRLAPHHGDLGQVNDHGNSQGGEGILHPVDDRDEGLHPLIARHGGEGKVILQGQGILGMMGVMDGGSVNRDHVRLLEKRSSAWPKGENLGGQIIRNQWAGWTRKGSLIWS